MQLIGLVWGMLAMLGFAVAFLPCLGSLNWLNIPFAIVGLVISFISTSQAPRGRRATGTAAIILNLIAVIFGFLRLAAGHFIF